MWRCQLPPILLVVAWTALGGRTDAPTAAPGRSVVAIRPPEAGFYGKRLDYDGIPIKAAAIVSDQALRAARQRLQRMLERAPTIRANLARAGAELHVIGKDQVTSDLPEHRHLRGKPFDGRLTVDQRTRGLGGLFASCGEENLLELPGDRYAGRDICVHEFAHTVRAYGLDAGLRQKIDVQYRRSLDQGRWKGAYAGSNDDEFFAELSMWYFGTEGDTARLSPRPARGRQGLRKYDPEAFELLDRIYSGRAAPARLQVASLPALPAERENSLRSLSAKEPATVLFINRTAGELKLTWIDYRGKGRPFAVLGPGGLREQHTYATHAWILSDTGGKTRAIFVAVPGLSRAVVEGRPAPATR